MQLKYETCFMTVMLYEYKLYMHATDNTNCKVKQNKFGRDKNMQPKLPLRNPCSLLPSSQTKQNKNNNG